MICVLDRVVLRSEERDMYCSLCLGCDHDSRRTTVLLWICSAQTGSALRPRMVAIELSCSSSSFQWKPSATSIRTLRHCRSACNVVCPWFPAWSCGQLSCADGVSPPFPCWRPPRILDIVLECDPHHLLLPSPHYVWLFLFSIALFAL